MKLISLINSAIQVMIDDEDYDRVIQYRWSVSRSRTSCYAFTNINDRPTRLHHFILGITPDIDFPVCHLDGNPWNNQKCNLQQMLVSDNRQGVTWNKKTSSKYLGVCWHAKNKTWRCRINKHGQVYDLGCSQDQEFLARKYNQTALELYRPTAKLNVFSDQNGGQA